MTIMIDFRAIETFYWVTTLGSFGAAARKLNATQPAISQRIAVLEATLGERLLTRGPKQVVATPSGRELMIYAEKLLSLRSELMARFADRSSVQGVLRLGVAETIVHTWLPDLIKAVNQRYPRLSIEIEVDISPSLRARLLAQEIDLAFLIGPLTASTVKNRNLDEYRLAFLASPELGLPRRTSLAELVRFAIITFSRGTQPYEALRLLFQSPALPAVTLNASASLATVVHLAVEGLGVAAIPPDIVSDEIKAGRLIEIETGAPLPTLKFSASWLGAPDAHAIEAVADLAVRISGGWQSGTTIRPARRSGRGRAGRGGTGGRAKAPAESR